MSNSANNVGSNSIIINWKFFKRETTQTSNEEIPANSYSVPAPENLKIPVANPLQEAFEFLTELGEIERSNNPVADKSVRERIARSFTSPNMPDFLQVYDLDDGLDVSQEGAIANYDYKLNAETYEKYAGMLSQRYNISKFTSFIVDTFQNVVEDVDSAYIKAFSGVNLKLLSGTLENAGIVPSENPREMLKQCEEFQQAYRACLEIAESELAFPYDRTACEPVYSGIDEAVMKDVLKRCGVQEPSSNEYERYRQINELDEQHVYATIAETITNFEMAIQNSYANVDYETLSTVLKNNGIMPSGNIKDLIQQVDSLKLDASRKLSDASMVYGESSFPLKSDTPEQIGAITDKFGDNAREFYGSYECMLGRFTRLKEQLNIQNNEFSFVPNGNHNNSFDRLALYINGSTYQLEQEFFHDSNYPEKITAVITRPDGTISQNVSEYRYNNEGLLQEVTIYQGENNFPDASIQYDDEYGEIISFANLPVSFLDISNVPLEDKYRQFGKHPLSADTQREYEQGIEQAFSKIEPDYLSWNGEKITLSDELTQSIVFGGLYELDNAKMTLTSDNFILTYEADGEYKMMFLDSQGYMDKNTFAEFISSTEGNTSFSRYIDTDQDVKFRFTKDGVQKMYPNGYVVEYVQESDNSWKAKNGDGVKFNELNFDGNYTSFSQGDVEDDWLLSGIISFASSPQGLKILQDACKRVDRWGKKDSNKIELDNKKYKVDDSTVRAYQEEYVGGENYGQRNTNHPYSFGDSDVTALEIAFTRYLEKQYGNQVYVTKPEEILKAGSFNDFSIALTGRSAFVCTSSEYNDFDTYGRRNFDLYFDALEQTPSAGVISFVPQNGKDIIGSAQGQAVQMTTGDENTWAIKSVQGNYVTLVNPCNTSIEYTFERKELEEISASVSIVQFDK